MWKLVLLAALLISCGNSLNRVGNPRDKKDEEQVTCPKTNPTSFHQVSVQFSSPPPNRLTVFVDGERKVDECRVLPKEPPVVKLKREANNKVTVVVEHKDFFTELPETISLSFYQMEGCAKEEAIFEIRDLALDFVDDYPAGEKCPGRKVAKADVIKR